MNIGHTFTFEGTLFEYRPIFGFFKDVYLIFLWKCGYFFEKK
jgi:hypothetical protein